MEKFLHLIITEIDNGDKDYIDSHIKQQLERKIFWENEHNHKSNFLTRLVLVSDTDRGIGKTQSLLEISNKYRIPIITGYRVQETLLKEKGAKYVCLNSDIRGKKFDNGVLLDEMVDIETIFYLHSLKKIRGGFISDTYLVDLIDRLEKDKEIIDKKLNNTKEENEELKNKINHIRSILI